MNDTVHMIPANHSESRTVSAGREAKLHQAGKMMTNIIIAIISHDIVTCDN